MELTDLFPVAGRVDLSQYKYSEEEEEETLCSDGVRVLWLPHSLGFRGGSDGRERIRGSRSIPAPTPALLPSHPTPSRLAREKKKERKRFPPRQFLPVQAAAADTSAAWCRFRGDLATPPPRPRGSVSPSRHSIPPERSREAAAATKEKKDNKITSAASEAAVSERGIRIRPLLPRRQKHCCDREVLIQS